MSRYSIDFYNSLKIDQEIYVIHKEGVVKRKIIRVNLIIEKDILDARITHDGNPACEHSDSFIGLTEKDLLIQLFPNFDEILIKRGNVSDECTVCGAVRR